MSSTEKTNAAGGDKLSMKLLVNSKSQRVLYAEAGKDVVDFLFSLLTLPLGTAKAPQTTLQIFRCTGTYLPNCRSYVTMASETPCGSCGARMTTQALLVGSVGGAGSPAAAAGAAGFVQRIVTYTVMDDLKIAPMSTISGITILNTFGITDIGSLQEKTVQLGYAEGLEMLKASLQSKTVLTDVFLGKKRKASSP
ncbi:hypothetical protein TRIUR3_22243 [Triticum urartu]|uniref:DUF674 domain-containing protein n=2 Tax=Triticum TaxID=4564 RepID=A0A9R0RDF0_TRITD|nr:hypothetical protein TRIUR3_22243 [Triticum urartu]VAH58545.1 unnamed protein product [Triticum turgidum subsp. durum]